MLVTFLCEELSNVRR